MKFEINSMLCVLVVLTGSSQTRGQSSTTTPVPTLAALPSHAGSSASPDLTEDPGNEARQWTHNPAGRDESSPHQTTTVTKAEGTVHSEDAANAEHETHLLTTSPAAAAPVITSASPSAAAEGLSSTPSAAPPEHLSTAGGGALLTTDPLATFSSQPAHTAWDARSTAHASTVQPVQSESLTTAAARPTSTGQPLSSAPGQAPAGPTHPEVPSELNVGDEDLKGPRFRSSSPLDPLLAGLLSVFIVTTAIVFVVLFLKFRQRTNHPEFHRLQDLPMDDLMEDTPLSRYTY